MDTTKKISEFVSEPSQIVPFVKGMFDKIRKEPFDPFWDNMAEGLLISSMEYVLKQDGTMGDVCLMLDYDNARLVDTFSSYDGTKDRADELTVNCVKVWNSITDRAKAAVNKCE